jgi:DNA-directed RNA polymerase specialized sigma24 family protein
MQDSKNPALKSLIAAQVMKPRLPNKERYIKRCVDHLLSGYESSQHYYIYQEQMLGLLKRLFRNENLERHWAESELKQVKSIIHKSFCMARENAHRTLKAKKHRCLTSFEGLQELGFDVSSVCANDDMELLTMPRQADALAAWAANDDEIKMNSALNDEFVEFFLQLPTLDRQIIAFAFTTLYTTQAIADILDKSYGCVNQRKASLMQRVQAWREAYLSKH